MRTQVGIIGAGPAGLFLAHLLRQAGVESVILESRSRAYVESRVRAGVLEAGTVETLSALGLDARMKRECMIDDGLDIRFRGKTIHLDLPGLTGQHVVIYGQQEVVKDLIASCISLGQPLEFEAKVTRLTGLDGERPEIHYLQGGEDKVLTCDFIAGCDGYHGVSRAAVPEGKITHYEKTYDFAWLGVLSRSPPLPDMTYTNSDRGFALCSRRSTQVSRLYLQVGADENPEAWSDARFWDELHQRMFDADKVEIVEGEIFQRDVARLRSFIAAPMQYGRLYLAGDAVHITPPTGAKGLNLAVADVRSLAGALGHFYRTSQRDKLARYSEHCLKRVWRTVGYSTRMTELLHKFPEQGAYRRELQFAELDFIHSSRAAQAAIAEQYVGMPYEPI
jgi:p-hydroxybenzoate 3-monooxygenase